MTCPVLSCDVLVLGAGIAGLEAALTAAEAGRDVMTVTKGPQASAGVLGFCAPVGETDSAEKFAGDTFRGGWELGEKPLIRALAEGSAETVAQMEALGLTFDRAPDGKGAYQLLRPLGCSVPRLVRHENSTGRASMALLREACLKRGVRFIEGAQALELTVSGGAVSGAVCMRADNDEPFIARARAVVLATGGAHLMKNSTYPTDQTADGMAMAYRAGARLTDLEFIQHEPCRAVWPKPLGLSTTLLNKGGVLKNRLGERFVLRHYPAEGAAPKDILARLIALEIREGRGSEHGGVYLDLTGIPGDEIKNAHRLYYERFLREGIDLTRDIIEVGPAPHSMMGGVLIDENAWTKVPGLYAAGEVTGGLHGANRLGGNAGAETYVFGRAAGRAAAGYASGAALRPIDPSDKAEILKTGPGAEKTDFRAGSTGARAVAARALGPVRDGAALGEAVRELDELLKALESSVPDSLEALRLKTEACHLTGIALLACRAALERTESRGVHYRADYPERRDPEWKKHIIFTRGTDKETGTW
ncbi:MAG: FAD-binding protein [Clostridia bacterium]|nr:FAD-binding protein [Clostridia bacterium]